MTICCLGASAEFLYVVESTWINPDSCGPAEPNSTTTYAVKKCIPIASDDALSNIYSCDAEGKLTLTICSSDDCSGECTPNEYNETCQGSSYDWKTFKCVESTDIKQGFGLI